MPAIKSKLDKPVLAHDGYMYRFDRDSSDGGKFWRCLRYQCLGRIKTDINNVFIEFRNGNHTHPANEEASHVKTVVTSMKTRAETEPTSLVEIYRSETVQLAAQPAAAASMPTYQEVSLITLITLIQTCVVICFVLFLH
jgi:phosphatidylserine/phosphatidylglycerophosphate/cardiolipin synthase-like enzyme